MDCLRYHDVSLNHLSMNQQRLSILLSIVLALFVGGLVYWALPHQPITPTTEVASTTAPAVSSAKGPSPTTTPKNATYPSIVPKDGMSTSVQGGVVPFTVSFTLKLNANRSCSVMKYALVFGDNIEKDVQVPQDQCAKPYAVVVYHQYQRAGIFTATLSTKPVVGAGVVLSQIIITAKDPSVTSGTTKTATFTTSPVTGSSPVTVHFSLSAVDSENSDINYIIVFGDGQTATFPQTVAPTLSHLYRNPGTFIVTVSRGTQCSTGQCFGPSTPIGTVTVTVI